MDVLELMNRLGGEVLSARVRANVDGKIVVIGRMEGDKYVFTEAGQALANVHSNLKVAEQATKAPKTRKSKATEVESVQITEDVQFGLGTPSED